MKQKQLIDMDMVLTGDEVYVLPTAGEVVEKAFSILYQQCHGASYNRGWWMDPVTGLSLIPHDTTGSISVDMTEASPIIEAWFPFVVATKIALIHSEVSEMLEAYRTDARDDKIDFPGITAEAGDTVIRICDLLGMLSDQTERFDDYNIGLAILSKMPVNGVRADHSMEARRKPGGKKF